MTIDGVTIKLDLDGYEAEEAPMGTDFTIETTSDAKPVAVINESGDRFPVRRKVLG